MKTRDELLAAAEALEWAESLNWRDYDDLAMQLMQRQQELLAQAASLPAQEPVAWIRFASDGGYDGPIADVDRRMDGIRKNSGAWTPLYTTPPDQTARIALLEGLLRESEEALSACTTEEGAELAELVRARQTLERIRAALEGKS